MAMSRSLGRSLTSLSPILIFPGDLLEPGDHPQGRWTSPAGGADQHHKLAVRDIEIEILDRPKAVGIPLGYVIEARSCDCGHISSSGSHTTARVSARCVDQLRLVSRRGTATLDADRVIGNSNRVAGTTARLRTPLAAEPSRRLVNAATIRRNATVGMCSLSRRVSTAAAKVAASASSGTNFDARSGIAFAH